MAQRSHVPKFGNWESEENVPYTAYFDKARKDKTGPGTKMINPNDPQENPDLLRENSSSRPNSEEHIRKGSVKSTHERGKSREDNDFRNYIKSPARSENVGNRLANDFPNQHPGSRGVGSTEYYRRTAKQSVGSEQSIERSPLHRKADGANGFASPSREGKNFYDSSHGTPGKSRLRPFRGDEILDRGAAVPKFGEWDEKNPASADGFTHIFNAVREQRQGGVASSPSMPSKATYPGKKQPTSDSVSCCCFAWRAK